MTARLKVILDCCDPERLAAFWSEALGYTCPAPFGQCWPLLPPAARDRAEVGQEPKAPRPPRSRISRPEARRLEALGALRISEKTTGTRDSEWYVMADPEGNEFCIVRPGG